MQTDSAEAGWKGGGPGGHRDRVARPGRLFAIALVLGTVCLIFTSGAADAVAGSISGKVTNGSSVPLEDICADALDPSGEFVDVAFTGPDGRYAIKGLENGTYRVEFSDCGDNGVAGEFYDDKPSFGLATPVVVSGGSATTGINAALGSGGSISGTVTGSSANPLEGICVDVYDVDGNFVSGSSTGADGTYSVAGLSGGKHKVEFYDCGQNNVAGEFYDNRPDLASAHTVVVTTGSETAGINASLASGGSISGTVTDSKADPLEDICVDAYDSSGDDSGYGITGPDGGYTVDGLPAGKHRIRFSDCGDSNVATEFYDDRPGLASADPVNVAAGAEVSGVDASLASGGSISGTVTDSSAKPLEDICVDAYDSSGVASGSGYTEADGTYSVGALGGGNYRVRFYDCGSNGVEGEFYDNRPKLASANQIGVTAGTETAGIDAVLAALGSRGGDGGSGRAWISRIKVSGPRRIRVGKAATFRLKVRVAGNTNARSVKLRVSGRGVRTGKNVGEIVPGKVRKVRVRLRPAKRGRIRLTFRLVSDNAGRKNVARRVTVTR